MLCGTDYSTERVSFQAGWQQVQVMQKIRDKKKPFMLWSKFMTDFHDELFSRFEILTS